MTAPLIPTEIETERLVLRRPAEADADALVAVFDAEVVRYLDGHVPSRDDLWRSIATWLGHWELRGYGMYTWVEKTTGTVVGRGGLWYPSGWPQIEVGWTLGRAHWGRGYATEAGRAVLETARHGLRLKRLDAGHFIDNPASGRVLEKLGFRPVGKIVPYYSAGRGEAAPCRLFELDFAQEADVASAAMAA